MKSNVDKGGIAITCITLILFAVSLGALLRGKNPTTKNSGVTSNISYPSTDSVETSSKESTLTLDEKIDGIELVGIKGAASADHNDVVFVALIKNVQGLEINEGTFLAVNKETGAKKSGMPSSFVDTYTVGKEIGTAVFEGVEKVSSIHFGIPGHLAGGNGNLPYGNYDVTFTFGFDGSNKKISISRSFSFTEDNLIKSYTEV